MVHKISINMKFDFNYLKYQLKSFIFSDFKSLEISRLLNNLEPEDYIERYISMLDINNVHSKIESLRLKKILEKAKEANVPLSIDYGQYKNPEDAYLARQRYINLLIQKEQFLSHISKSILLLSIAAVALLIILVSNS